MQERLGTVGANGRSSPLEAVDYMAIAAGTRALRPLRKGERVATGSGWAMILGGAWMLLFAGGSAFTMALGVGLIVLGWRELSMRHRLATLDAFAGGRLAQNQLIVGSLFVGYGIVQFFAPPETLNTESTGSPEIDRLVAGLPRMMQVAAAAGFVFQGLVVNGCMAAYYARLGKRVRAAYATTPLWVMKVHAAAWSGRVPDETVQTAGGTGVPRSQAAA